MTIHTYKGSTCPGGKTCTSVRSSNLEGGEGGGGTNMTIIRALPLLLVVQTVIVEGESARTLASKIQPLVS